MASKVHRRNRRPRVCVCPPGAAALAMSVLFVDTNILTSHVFLHFSSDVVIDDLPALLALVLDVENAPDLVVDAVVGPADVIDLSLDETIVTGGRVNWTVTDGFLGVVGVDGEVLISGKYTSNINIL